MYISFRVNEMEIVRIISNDFSSFLGFQANYFYTKRQEDGSFAGKIVSTTATMKIATLLLSVIQLLQLFMFQEKK